MPAQKNKNIILRSILLSDNQELYKIIKIPAAILICFLLLAIQPDLSLAIPELTSLSALIVILLAIGQRVCSRDTTDCSDKNCIAQSSFISDSSGQPWSARFILTFALLLRLMFLFSPPELSDDLYRYCLDGIMLISGENPYSHAPLDLKELTPAISALVPLVNHPDLPTIYPPAAQIVFATGALAGKLLSTLAGMMSGLREITSALAEIESGAMELKFMLTGMKLLLIVMDMLSCLLIIEILKKMRLPLCRATIYAWHPLPVLEIGSSGHIDGAALFFLLMAIYVALNPEIRRGYWWSVLTLSGLLSGIFMGLSVLTKWMPLIFFPALLFLLRCRRNRIAATGGLTAVTGVLVTLFWPDIVNSLNTLSLYLQNWEFSGFLFRVVRGGIEGHVAKSGVAARIMIAVGFLYLACKIVFRLLKDHTLQAVMRSFFLVTFAWLILTPTLYPWYSVYLVAFLPFYLNTAGLTLTWSVMLSYQVLIPYRISGQWIEGGITPLMITAAPAATFVGQYLLGIAQKNRACFKIIQALR